MSEPLTEKQFDGLAAGICPDCKSCEWVFMVVDGFRIVCVSCESKFLLDYDAHGRLIVSRRE